MRKILIALVAIVLSASCHALTVKQYKTNMPIEGGIWFGWRNAPTITPFEYILSIPMTNLLVGEVLQATSTCEVSLRATPGHPETFNYPGFNAAAFTAGVISLSIHQPGYDMTGPSVWGTTFDGSLISPQSGGDIWPSGMGGQYNPYFVHNHHGTMEITSSTVGNKWVTLILWATSDGLSSPDTQWLLVEPSECQMDVLRFTP